MSVCLNIFLKNIAVTELPKLKVICYIKAIFLIYHRGDSLGDTVQCYRSDFRVRVCDIFSAEYFQWRDCDIQ